jgi:general secretion pathway protein C
MAVHDNPRMLPTSYTRWRIRTATGLTWAAAAAAAVYWGLRLSGPVGAAPAAAPPPAPVAAVDAASLARLLGALPGPAAPPPSSLASRMQLQGVIADRRQGGTALIAVDGKPARPYRAGVAIEPGLVVLALGHRSATLGASGGPAAATLEMPPLPTVASSAPASGGASAVPMLPTAPGAPPAYGAAPATQPLVLPQSAPLGGSPEPAAPITN